MGNQQSGSMSKMSSRFTLRGLSWRPPKKSLPPLPGEDMPPNRGPPPSGPPNDRRPNESGEWDPEASDDGEWGEESQRGSWIPWKSQRMTRDNPSQDLRRTMASTMMEASERNQSVRQSALQGARESTVSGWSTGSVALKGPEFKELYDKLVAFYMKHDPDAVLNKEIDISGMTKWCLESEDGSLEELNEKLTDRFGENLDDLEGNSRPLTRIPSSRPSATMKSSSDGTAKSGSQSSPFDSDSDEDEESDDESWMPGGAAALPATRTPAPARSSFASKAPSESQEQIKDQLERFFLQYEPEALNDIDEYMEEFNEHGRMALNVKLFRAFGKNLTTMTQGSGPAPSRKSSSWSAADSVSPESMGPGANSQRPSVRKASKFGVHVAPDEVLGEMSHSTLASRSSTIFKKPSGFPDFTTKRQQKIEEKRKQSNVSASLQRKWNHLANRNRGISTRISTRISTKFQGMRAPVPAQSKPVVEITSKPSPAVAPKVVIPRTGLPVETLPKKAQTGCPRFQINLEGEFGTCKNCGRKKKDHFEDKGPKIAPTLARRWKKLPM